ncbi:hypothetical protein LHK_00845 [Laribacter hongkongensis HLHK9]|uniref:Uncharacterized protein n=1 Tax=Laribacter hongkongensis (strain HLHK9) TaxID=557598 RepID=C1D521_LARHH|nr:hypothetical protein LHK_00845 [Laribacter hongkongensis HLHK9]
MHADRVADIQRQRFAAAVAGGHGVVQRTDVGGDHAGTGHGKLAHDFAADALGGSRHQHRLAIEAKAWHREPVPRRRARGRAGPVPAVHRLRRRAWPRSVHRSAAWARHAGGRWRRSER